MKREMFGLFNPEIVSSNVDNFKFFLSYVNNAKLLIALTLNVEVM